MAELYRPLYLNRAPILITDRRTAELIKYAANAFLATKITFINEIADLCEKVGADVQEVARGIGLDNRIGGKFLHAGPGYGGSCFPKDTLALIKTGAGPRRAAAHRRDGRRGQRQPQARHGAQGRRRARRQRCAARPIAVLGLTFKPNTDDMRDAPSIPLITALQDMGAKVRAYDPVGMEQAKKVLPERDLLRRTLRLRRRAPTRWSSSPNGSSSARSISTGSRRVDGAAGARRPAQHLSARRDGAARLHLRERRAGRRSKAAELDRGRVRCARFDTALPDRRGAAGADRGAARSATPRCWSRRPAPARPRACRWCCSTSPGRRARKSWCWSRAGSPRAPPPSAWRRRSARRSATRSACACASARRCRARRASRSSPKACSPG